MPEATAARASATSASIVLPAHAAIQGLGVAVPAAEQLVDGQARRLAEQVPEREVHPSQRFELRAGRVAAHALGGVEPLPEAVDLPRILSAQDRREQVGDHALVHARRRGGMAFAPADEALVGRDLDEHRLLEAFEARRAGVIEPVPDAGPTRHVADGWQLEGFVERDGLGRSPDDQGLDAADAQRCQRVASLLAIARDGARLCRCRRRSPRDWRPPCRRATGGPGRTKG